MSVEDYRVQLLTARDQDGALAVLTARGFMAVSDPTLNDMYLVWEDERFIIEASLSDRIPGELSVMMRFALCQHATIETAFLRLVEDVKRDLGATFASADETLETVRLEIAEQRGYWQQTFGTETARLTCREALLRFVIR